MSANRPDERTPAMLARQRACPCSICRLQSECDDLRAALTGMVDLYRHPDGGRLLVEPGGSPEDDALIAAMAVLGES